MLHRSLIVFRLIALLCAGAFIYNMGHGAAAAPTDPSTQQQPAVAAESPLQARSQSQPTTAQPSQPPIWSAIAQTGSVWLARQVHEQTAWAAAAPAEGSSTSSSSQLASAAPVEDADAQPDQAQAVAPVTRTEAPARRTAVADAAPSAHRLRIEYAPSLAATAAQLAR